MWLFGEDRRSAVEAMGAVLWAWLSRCMECTAVLCPKLLRDGVAAKAERIQLLAILTGKERAAVQGLPPERGCLGCAGGGGEPFRCWLPSRLQVRRCP